MDKWATLEPVKLYTSAATSTGARLLRGSTIKQPASRASFIGPLPADLHQIILSHLPISDIPAYARCSRSFARLTQEESLWEKKWNALGIEAHKLSTVLDDLESKPQSPRAAAPPTISVDADDDFGDFSSASSPMPSTAAGEMGIFVGASFTSFPVSPMMPSKPTFRARYMRAHALLKSLLPALRSPSHLITTSLFPPTAGISIRQQSKTLRLLGLFLSRSLQPVVAWASLRAALRTAIDRFEANLLTMFDSADGRGDESAMRDAAWASWEVWSDEHGSLEWELGKVWAEKREIFYEGERWQPSKNFTPDNALDFNAMDEFMTHVTTAIQEHGARAMRIFPAEAGVLLAFSDKLAVEVVSEYIMPLLSHARGISNEVFLRATAATFVQAWKMVDAILEAGGQTEDRPDGVSRTQAEDVVFRMFEPNMDEYLDEEVEYVKQAFETICRAWEKKLSSQSAINADSARFLASQNPAQVKRNVLASFTNVLLLPVTIVPRTVGAIVATGSTAAVNGISMLNPQRWGGQASKASSGYQTPFGDKDNELVFENGLDDDDSHKEKVASPSASIDLPASSRESMSKPSFDRLELLLSLDVALELIHADRECLKRTETFQGYPGPYGHKVRETIEELFILMLQVMNERHIHPGFSQATEQMRTYKPAEHAETTSVAPLMQFFELVHLGDMIQSMVQVYFDKELANHIDRTDFLNGVVREKKRFENALDDAVAGGLNAGTEVLMNQVEHIIWTRTGPREYYPQEGTTMELGPTLGCREAISCLEMHCKLLKGSTSKEVLEVFYQEVGIRLHGIIQKHIKRQIISLEGGFQVIADLNAYHAFISSLKIQQITNDFSHLKMLGHVYIVSDAKDLAQIVRDVARYGGAFRPEDIYEFIQRRSDWKKIEKTVDKTMYNLSFKEDCVIA